GTSGEDTPDAPDATGGQDALPPTILLVEGSTGGAGLRGLQGAEPEPLAASILYFDAGTRHLVAYDRLTVKGLGETGATIQRHIVSAPGEVPDDDGEESRWADRPAGPAAIRRRRDGVPSGSPGPPPAP